MMRASSDGTASRSVVIFNGPAKNNPRVMRRTGMDQNSGGPSCRTICSATNVLQEPTGRVLIHYRSRDKLWSTLSPLYHSRHSTRSWRPPRQHVHKPVRIRMVIKSERIGNSSGHWSAQQPCSSPSAFGRCGTPRHAHPHPHPPTHIPQPGERGARRKADAGSGVRRRASGRGHHPVRSLS